MKAFFNALLECLKADGQAESKTRAEEAAFAARLGSMGPRQWIGELLGGSRIAWANLLVLSATNDCELATRRELYRLSPFADELVIYLEADGGVKVLPESMRMAGKKLGYVEEFPGDFQPPMVASFSPEELICLHPKMFLWTYE